MPEPELVEALIVQVASNQARVKFAASKALRELAAEAPDSVYPYFNFFAALLGHNNRILKWNAMLTLANLATVDREAKLDEILDAYLAPIAGPDMISAANAILGAAMIATAKPHLADRIAERIFHVERASYATRECINVAIGHAVHALERFFPVVQDKRAV